MTRHYFCSLWKSILFKQANFNRYYNDFLVDKIAAATHLQSCRICDKLIAYILPEGAEMPDLASLTSEKLYSTIKRLRYLARQKNQAL